MAENIKLTNTGELRARISITVAHAPMARGHKCGRRPCSTCCHLFGDHARACGGPSLAAQGLLCLHEGKAHSPGGVARIADSQLYVRARHQRPSGVAFWEPAQAATRCSNANP